MRQLDLFGSFFETASQEDKPEEKTLVSKKQERANPSAGVPSAYSKNTLRSERLVAEVTSAEKTTEAAVKQPTNGTTVLPPPLNSPVVLSLFDAPTIAVSTSLPEEEIELTIETEAEGKLRDVREEQISEDQQFSNGIAYEPQVLIIEDQLEQNSEVETGQVATAHEPLVLIVEEPSEQITEVKNVQAVSANEPEVLVVEEQREIAESPVISAALVEIKKKAAEPKPKKQVLPELKTNGSVIFDDGKITVKIKSTSPFPAPIIKEKKERIKKPAQKRGRKSFKEIDAEVDLIEIPEDEILFQKQYYPISEVARWFRVNTSLLRFWENEFDVLKPRKNRKGDRLFRPEDVKNLQLIYQLLRQRKYTIEGAKEYIKTNKKKADIQLHLTNTLQKFKSFLLDLKVNLQP